MGELARRRHAKDLWISFGHVRAGAIAFLAIVTGAFVAGYSVAGSAENLAPDQVPWLADAADQELVDLLARVDASAEADGGLSRLGFPEMLSEADADLPVPSGELAVAGGITVATGADAMLAATDMPEGWVLWATYDSLADLRTAYDRLSRGRVEGWRMVRLDDGSMRVGLLGLDSRASAEAALLRVEPEWASTLAVASWPPLP